VFTGKEAAMDAVTPMGSGPPRRILILFAPTAWSGKRPAFPGCEAKTLLFDRTTGLMTALMRFAPGAVLPDHEHVNIEQTYVLEGSLVDKEGPAKGIECKAGEFVWREQGSRHVAWCPQGGLMLAIFQVPTSSSRPTAASSMPRARTGTRPGGIPARPELIPFPRRESGAKRRVG
jgi:Anti-sigma factor